MRPRGEKRLSPTITLIKPRIALLVALSTGLGWAISGGRCNVPFVILLVGVTLSSFACGSLNQYRERSVDALMKRTSNRPLPSGLVTPRYALGLGLVLSIVGPTLIFIFVSRSAALLTALTIALYVLVYTPLKKVTPHATWVGAAAGALPPLIGSIAFQPNLSAISFTLFAIQFLWQIPHFLALFWIHRDDYARAGFKVMPVIFPDGSTTAIQIALHCFTLLPVTLLPVLLGLAGLSYAISAITLGIIFLGFGMRASWTLSLIDTRRLFLASLAYLPLIFGMILFGGV